MYFPYSVTSTVHSGSPSLSRTSENVVLGHKNGVSLTDTCQMMKSHFDHAKAPSHKVRRSKALW